MPPVSPPGLSSPFVLYTTIPYPRKILRQLPELRHTSICHPSCVHTKNHCRNAMELQKLRRSRIARTSLHNALGLVEINREDPEPVFDYPDYLD